MRLKSKRDLWVELGISAVLLLVLFMSVYPFYYVLIASLSDPQTMSLRPIYFVPNDFSLKSYTIIFEKLDLLQPLLMSVLRTVVGMLVTVFGSSVVGYVLSHRNLIGRQFWISFFVVTMYFSAGIIPTYLLINGLGLTDSFWVYILPSVVSVYEMILVKAYMENIPASIEESATVDGANELTVFFRLIIPLSVPILATIAIFTGVVQWNSWYDTMVYNINTYSLWTLQMHLKDIIDQTGALRITSSLDAMRLSGRTVTPTTIRLAITVITTLPIVIIYPFFQRYFMSGVMLGAVKE